MLKKLFVCVEVQIELPMYEKYDIKMGGLNRPEEILLGV